MSFNKLELNKDKTELHTFTQSIPLNSLYLHFVLVLIRRYSTSRTPRSSSTLRLTPVNFNLKSHGSSLANSRSSSLPARVAFRVGRERRRTAVLMNFSSYMALELLLFRLLNYGTNYPMTFVLLTI